jgi:hypothetical protein
MPSLSSVQHWLEVVRGGTGSSSTGTFCEVKPRAGSRPHGRCASRRKRSGLTCWPSSLRSARRQPSPRQNGSSRPGHRPNPAYASRTFPAMIFDPSSLKCSWSHTSGHFSGTVDHLAYLARRHAEAGEARVSEAHSRQEVARAQEDRNKILMDARSREAQNGQAHIALLRFPTPSPGPGFKRFTGCIESRKLHGLASRPGGN